MERQAHLPFIYAENHRNQFEIATNKQKKKKNAVSEELFKNEIGWAVTLAEQREKRVEWNQLLRFNNGNMSCSEIRTSKFIIHSYI